ncbi:MAG TPA: serine/threonine-protein kinase, partial [Pyrinomonadaceae bacterium]|nr:serine/threonine-protein kinase [Pyrinomonadaceae bacterium]
GETDGIYFIATEFIEGLTIRQLLASSELSAGAILDIAAQVASALAAAHAAGIVHRDIKPENIMRRSDGLVKILDFGIAKLLEPESQPDADNRRVAGETHTEAGLVMGTVSYMSPEQARGLPVDERTDIWSFGVVLYEMLSKRLPFRGATRMDTLVAILDREPVPLCEVAGRLNANSRLPQVIDRCLRKEAGERYRTAHELIADLRNVVVDPEVGKVQAVSVTSNEAAAREREEFRRRDLRRRYLMALTVFALLLVTSIVIILSRRSGAHWSLTGSGSSETAKVYSQMTEAERLTFIDQQEQRISTMMGDRPVKLNPDALSVIKTYVDRDAARNETSGQVGEETLNDVYTRATPYVPLIARSFAARKVPVIIGIYLPVIESAYRNCYESNIGAKGLFQFLPQTAKNYGVAPDEMCDVEKMTPAAADYIADRMAELGEDSESMTLVLLSYNRGAEAVRTNLRQLRTTENYERNFWTLFAHRDQLDSTFREEGANYVPSFFAAAIIGENPRTFGLTSAPLSSLAARDQSSGH